MIAIGIFSDSPETRNIRSEGFKNKVAGVNKRRCFGIVVMFEQIFYKTDKFVLIERRFKRISNEIFCLFVSHVRFLLNKVTK